MTLIFDKLPTETTQLTIRLMEPGDLPQFLDFILDPESTRHLAFTDEQKTEAGAKELFETVLQFYHTKHPIESYAVALKETNQYIGSVGFAPYDDDIFECYYTINKEHRGNGYANQAMSHLFSLIDGHVVLRAFCTSDNHASIRVAKQLNMAPLGEVEHRHTKLKGPAFELQI